MKALIEYVARSLVDEPDQVRVNEVDQDETAVFELIVAKDDLGKVIGKNGRTAKALRTVLQAASAKLHKRAVLEILD